MLILQRLVAHMVKENGKKIWKLILFWRKGLNYQWHTLHTLFLGWSNHFCHDLLSMFLIGVLFIWFHDCCMLLEELVHDWLCFPCLSCGNPKTTRTNHEEDSKGR